MITFTTFTTFLLLATLLFVTLVAVKAMRGERAELRHNCDLLDSVIELQEELTSLYEQRAEREALLVEKTQQIHDLQEKLFETKESFKPWIESLQEESDEWADIAKDAKDELVIAQECIWDKERQLSELAEANQKVADTLLALSYKEKPVTPRELTELREVALRWDQIPF